MFHAYFITRATLIQLPRYGNNFLGSIVEAFDLNIMTLVLSSYYCYAVAVKYHTKNRARIKVYSCKERVYAL